MRNKTHLIAPAATGQIPVAPTLFGPIIALVMIITVEMLTDLVTT